MLKQRLAITLFSATAMAIAGTTVLAETGRETGLPLPRFVSLKSDEVNARTGPGIRHPIRWVYKREDMPVEITAEWDTWRRIKDVDGDEGWVHQMTLSGKRTAVVIRDLAPLRADDDEDAGVVAHLERGVVLDIEECQDMWCSVHHDDGDGWIAKADVWGAG